MQSRRAVGLVVVLAVLVATFGIAGGASAAGNTLRLDPATTSVASGATFNVKVIQDTTVPTSGTAVTITFNKGVVQITTITRGPAFAAAPLFLAADASAIAAANKSGKLQGVAAAFFPPGSVPKGEQEFLTIGFKAVACGSSPLEFKLSKQNDGMLDGREATYGASLKIAGTKGALVEVCEAGASQPAAGASLDPNASVDPNASLDPNASVDPNASADPNASVDPNASLDPNASASPAPSASAPAAVVVPIQPTGSTGAGSTPEQQGWLTFALAGLAVAAVGIALLILLIVLISMVAAMVGGYYLMRYWRRGRLTDQAAEAAALEAAGATDAVGEGEVATDEEATEAGHGVPGAAQPAYEAPGSPLPLGRPSTSPSAG